MCAALGNAKKVEPLPTGVQLGGSTPLNQQIGWQSRGRTPTFIEVLDFSWCMSIVSCHSVEFLGAEDMVCGFLAFKSGPLSKYIYLRIDNT